MNESLNNMFPKHLHNSCLFEDFGAFTISSALLGPGKQKLKRNSFISKCESLSSIQPIGKINLASQLGLRNTRKSTPVLAGPWRNHKISLSLIYISDKPIWFAVLIRTFLHLWLIPDFSDIWNHFFCADLTPR